MYLKTIKLSGFKSFVDPTVVPVRSHMNAIVGPNGCGKSNIVDAIRWVIGESSAKKLRGQNSSDVIFNGTTSRKAVGKAGVELHFDNSAGRITGEYAKYTDLVIRREVEREGQSSYFLNGTHCRRRDILDVFLGTGLGPRSYSIIEQGMISQLIEAKPDDMRAHLEEVAGISKYKERRRETENRIRHTQDNLDRLNDLREELIKQLRHLKRQANAAERYQVYKGEERELSAQIKALHWQLLEEKRTKSSDLITEQALKREQSIAEQRECEADIDKTKIGQEQAQEAVQEVQKRFYGLGEQIARLEQQIAHYQEQISHWQSELNDSEQLWQELTDSTVEHREQISELESELEGLNPQQGEVSTLAQEANQALATAQADMQLWQQSWDEFHQSASQLDSQVKVAETKIEHQQQQLSQSHQRVENINQRLSQLSIDEVKNELDPLREQVETIEEKLILNKEAIEQNQDQISQKRDDNKNIQTDIQHKQRELRDAESKHATIHALQQAALGYDDKTIGPWLSQHNLTSQSRLGQQLNVNAGWEKAVETVLSGYFDAVCVDRIEDFVSQVGELADGRITLVEKPASQSTAVSTKASTLVSQINSDWGHQQWLEGIYIAETAEQAMQLRSQLALHESVITKDGLWVGKNWLRVSKIKDPQSGTLERGKQLELLSTDITALKEQLEQLDQQLKTGQQSVAELEQARDQMSRDGRALGNEISEAKSTLSSRTAQLEQLIQQEQRLQEELMQLTEQLSEGEQALNEARANSESLITRQQSLAERREALVRKRDFCREQLDNKRESAQRQQQQADELQIRLSSNESQLALLRQTIARDEKQLTNLTERREVLQTNLSDGDSPLVDLKEQLQQQLDARLTIEQGLKAAEANLTELRQRLKQYESLKESILATIDTIQTRLQNLRMESQEVVVRQQTIKEQLQETDTALETVIEGLPEEAEIKSWEERLEKLTTRIQRLGPINLAAIDEFQTGSERKEYLDKQFEDLTESLEVLQTAIRKIDRETKTRFRETYDKVNEGFKKNFPRIFGGGSAHLELLDDDLLTTGILVKAQPPGKRNSTIHMLSGGEKALTAISLVFAMFQLNPAPFCILDEVDAPLDDLNVSRFCQLVKEMSKETQFLIISHNKVTIETADHLMGVTMQEAGVSRLVAVDMDAAIELVEA